MDLDSVSLKSCRRCASTQPYIILDKVHLECKSCFLESCNKKIRSTIGKSKLVRNNDPILVSYSGGPASCALVDLIKNSIDGDTRREQKFRPSILHIDTQSILEPNANANEFRDKRLDQLRNLLESLRLNCPSWPIYWTTIESSYLDEANSRIFAKYTSPDDLNEDAASLLSNKEAHLTLQQNIANSGDLTDRLQFITDTCNKFIPKLALEINSSLDMKGDELKYVFTGSTSTQLANDLLVDVILGRGSIIRSTVGVCDKRHPVPIMRPLRDFSKKEIAYYLHARGINTSVQRDIRTVADQKPSIQTVTESFLTKLYVDYPSTYSTLLKTGNKML